MAKIRVYDLHTEYLGKLCKLTRLGLELEKEYEKLFGFGNYTDALRTYEYCHNSSEYQFVLMFIDEPPVKKNNMTWYCLKDVGVLASGDYHWFTLDQVMICSEN